MDLLPHDLQLSIHMLAVVKNQNSINNILGRRDNFDDRRLGHLAPEIQDRLRQNNPLLYEHAARNERIYHVYTRVATRIAEQRNVLDREVERIVNEMNAVNVE